MKNNKLIITVVIISSIFLYLAGVFSGLQASRIIEQKTEQDIETLKEETKQDIRFLQEDTEEQVEYLNEYIEFLETNLRSLQYEQAFAQTLEDKEQCRFSQITMGHLFSELARYWNILPYRIEQYEKENTLTDEYMVLKSQYTQLSVRTWMLAKSMHKQCDVDVVYGLHFYSTDCEDCVQQGEELDKLTSMVTDNGREFVLFPIDISSDESIVKVIKEYYRINSTPAVLLNDRVFQGRLYSAGELMEGLS